MQSEDYKRGVDDVLKWVERNFFPNSYTFDELNREFWKDRKTLTDDERFQKFKAAAADHILRLEAILEECEEAEPECFASDPRWFHVYIRWAWAKHLCGQQI